MAGSNERGTAGQGTAGQGTAGRDAERHARQARQAASFGVAAAQYERGRPPYPAAAIDWVLPDGVSRVLDLGAGTGKLTRQLRDRGLDVVAVDPSAGMREQLAHAVPGVAVHAGTAEDIPLPSGSVQAVVAAQAWHWVDPRRAVPEVARVLAPGGQLGLLWNIRDESVEWVATLGRILRDSGGNPGDSDRGTLCPPFGPVQRHIVRWQHRITPGQLIDLAASRSYVITLPPGERTALLAEVQQLAATHPALAGRSEITLPYLTECYRARLG